ncbi:hypothetical protein H310_07411 [Aphanomyces invadans]|uniref:Uncharacterized protein n=1 Tax=Aphanomyces invadans TaxID=157072 RepID=A0A024U258_9STRA|nr:hypothetical protein H310_07411 [Aphanomyces invadans]ETV99956.1 hypothetical protein H310_07411 [Aphanomyces invadans]|eukprot:XP_008871374.1 hypothetical protein H310_07411 [Aphanomyces invadans]
MEKLCQDPGAMHATKPNELIHFGWLCLPEAQDDCMQVRRRQLQRQPLL